MQKFEIIPPYTPEVGEETITYYLHEGINPAQLFSWLQEQLKEKRRVTVEWQNSAEESHVRMELVDALISANHISQRLRGEPDTYAPGPLYISTPGENIMLRACLHSRGFELSAQGQIVIKSPEPAPTEL